jgi:hypothetical protein
MAKISQGDPREVSIEDNAAKGLLVGTNNPTEKKMW